MRQKKPTQKKSMRFLYSLVALALIECCQHRVPVGDAAVGNPAFLAIEYVLVALFLNTGR